MIVRKSPSELKKMHAAGQLVRRILTELREMVGPGVTTYDLEVFAERQVDAAGARAAFKGYYVESIGKRFPTVLCTSINEEVVHGIPSKKRALKEGDIVKIDVGVQLEGYYGDSATTVPVGNITSEAVRLLDVTKKSLDLAIEKVIEGQRLLDICGTVQEYVEGQGFSVVREFVGHGIGAELHEPPNVPNYVDHGLNNPRLKTGMVLAIEPMVVAGKPNTKVLDDCWTAVTTDGTNAAHFEHCVAVTENGPWVLTA